MNIAKKRAQPEVSERDKPLYEALKKWRLEKSQAQNTPAYIYFVNEQLAAVAQARPKTLEELKRVSGIGSSKTEKYGSEVVSIVKQWIEKEKPNEPA
jgi:ATP-dependent DNA helicase RecQ